MLACDDNPGANGLLPVGIARVAVHASVGTECKASARLQFDDNNATAYVSIASCNNSLLVQFEGIRLQGRRREQVLAKNGSVMPSLYGESFEVIDLDCSEQMAEGTWLVLACEGCPNSQRIGDAIERRGGQVEIRFFDEEVANDPGVYRQEFRSTFALSPMTGIIYALPLQKAGDSSLDIAAVARCEVIRGPRSGGRLRNWQLMNRFLRLQSLHIGLGRLMSRK